MTWTYDAGTTTPNLAGLVEFNGVRINDGSFVLTSLGELRDGPPVRQPSTPLPSDHGGYVGTPFYGPLAFTLEGYVDVSVQSDLWDAMDYLRQAFNLTNDALQTLTFNTNGFAASRQVDARVAGPIVFEEPILRAKLVPQRNFSIPMIAPDPRAYATTTTSVTVALGGSGTTTTITNGGTVPTPFTLRIDGPVTNPQFVQGIASAPQIYLGGGFAIASGHYVEITTNPAAPGGITAVDDTGANVYNDITYPFNLTTLPVGANSFFVNSSGTGAGTAFTVTYRDAWA